ncbi:MAG: FecR family protein [Sphingobium sp.]
MPQDDSLAPTPAQHGHDEAARPKIRARAVVLIALILLILVIMVGARVMFLSPSPSSPATAGPALETRIGEVRQIALADGSQLILDTDTRIITAFTRKQRWIEVQQGRVRIVVGRDKIRPFLVRVGAREIVTTGAMFDVRHREGAGTGIHMIQGSIEIHNADPPEDGAGREKIILPSGENLLFPAAPDAAPVRSRALPSDGQWVDEIQGFKDVPAGDIIAQANAYGTDAIELADPAMASERITGQINIRSPAAAAEAIAAHLGLAVDHSRPGRIIIIGNPTRPDRQD